MSSDTTGTLYIVSTPIGNLEDITLRALRVLAEVDVIAAEDTRRTLKLLNKYQIKKKLLSYYQHNQVRRGKQLLRILQAGKNVALVSDAGTPGISDPGYQIIKLALEAGANVIPVPGPTALITALTVSGLPATSFIFLGFLSSRKEKRRRELSQLVSEPRTIVLYESPHRLIKTMEDIFSVMGDRYLVIARELTKYYEQIARGPVRELLNKFRQEKPRGEFVLIIKGRSW